MAQTFRKDPLSYRPNDEVQGRYRITGILGRGGFGAVYAAEHMGTRQPVALKVLTIDPTTSEDDVIQRFLREARITAQLRSHNTVRVFDVGEISDGPMFMAMEMLKGPELEKVLRTYKTAEQTMAEREAAELGVQVLKSLGEAHRHGLVHRDLKPANIMLADMGEDEPVVKVLDFGIARTEDSSLTGDGKALGTPAYMSPEQCMGKEVDGRSDLYSLAVILFRCVTGRLPFESHNSLALLGMHLHEAAPDPRTFRADLSDAMAACIIKGLDKKPADRYQSAKEMRQALQIAMGGAWAETPAVPLDALPALATQLGSAAGTPRPMTAPSLSAILCVNGEDLMAEATVAIDMATAAAEAPTRLANATDSVALAAGEGSKGQAAAGQATSNADAASGSSSGRGVVAVVAAVVVVALAAGAWVRVRAEPKTTSASASPASTSKPLAGVAAALAKPSPPPAVAAARAAATAAATAAAADQPAAAKPSSADVVRAKAQAQLAATSKDLSTKIEYLKEAIRLDPANSAYPVLRDTFKAALKQQVATKAAAKKVARPTRVRQRQAHRAAVNPSRKKRAPAPKRPTTPGDNSGLEIQALD